MTRKCRYGAAVGWLGFGLTTMKPAIIAIICYLIKTKEYPGHLGSIGILTFAGLDMLDGYLFESSIMGQNAVLKKIRRYLNAIGDRLAIQMVMLMTIWLRDFPALFYWLITGREVLVLSLVGYSFATYRPSLTTSCR